MSVVSFGSFSRVGSGTRKFLPFYSIPEWLRARVRDIRFWVGKDVPANSNHYWSFTALWRVRSGTEVQYFKATRDNQTEPIKGGVWVPLADDTGYLTAGELYIVLEEHGNPSDLPEIAVGFSVFDRIGALS